jgi:hypothetical protein
MLAFKKNITIRGTLNFNYSNDSENTFNQPEMMIHEKITSRDLNYNE